MPGKNKEAYVQGGGGSKKRATRKTTTTGTQVKGRKPVKTVRKRYPDTIKPATSMTQKVLRSSDAANKPINAIMNTAGVALTGARPAGGFKLPRLSKRTELDKKLAARKRRKK